MAGLNKWFQLRFGKHSRDIRVFVDEVARILLRNFNLGLGECEINNHVTKADKSNFQVALLVTLTKFQKWSYPYC